MIRFCSISLLLVFSFSFAGCVTSGTSTTPRTAVEQALLATAASRSVSDLRVPVLEGKSFAIKPESYAAVDKEYNLAALSEKLLEAKMKEVPAEDAEIIVIPRSAFAGIDEKETLIGIPKFPIPIPTVGVVETPEMALFKRSSQRGRNGLEGYAVDAESKELLFSFGEHWSETYYTRWTLFFFISFRTTDLPAPF